MKPFFRSAPATLSVALAALFSLSACQTAPTTAGAAPLAGSCGVAPSGELTAQRIVGANSTRTEPGLYEGPVWVKDALYFSDFTFADGFPSRIQRLDANDPIGR